MYMYMYLCEKNRTFLQLRSMNIVTIGSDYQRIITNVKRFLTRETGRKLCTDTCTCPKLCTTFQYSLFRVPLQNVVTVSKY